MLLTALLNYISIILDKNLLKFFKNYNPLWPTTNLVMKGLTAMLHYISIILVKYYIFLHDFFALAEMDITYVSGRPHRLHLVNKNKVPFFVWVTKVNSAAHSFVFIGPSGKKSQPFRRPIPMIWYNDQLPTSHRRLIWIYQTLLLRKRIYVP